MSSELNNTQNSLFAQFIYDCIALPISGYLRIPNELYPPDLSKHTGIDKIYTWIHDHEIFDMLVTTLQDHDFLRQRYNLPANEALTLIRRDDTYYVYHVLI